MTNSGGTIHEIEQNKPDIEPDIEHGNDPGEELTPRSIEERGRPEWLQGVHNGGQEAEGPDPLVWQTLTLYRPSKDADPKPTKTLANIVRILDYDKRWLNKIRYNAMAHRIEVQGEPITDDIVGEVCIWLGDHYLTEPAITLAQTALLVVAKRHSYQPVRDWLRTLKDEWDGKERIKRFAADYLGGYDTPLNAEIMKRWFISCVARAMKPGCKVDEVLILHGKQGKFKSTAFRFLASSEWFGDTPVTIGSKDAFLQMSGCWIYELAELDSIRRAESTAVKTFVSSQVDKFRPPFGRNVEEYPRSYVIVGSTNEDEFLSDPTGSRRYWPVHVEDIDRGAIERDREQLWAEAVHYYLAGEKWYLGNEWNEQLRQIHDQYAQSDSWEDRIEEWLVGRNNFVPTTEILSSCLEIEVSRETRGVTQRIAAIMARLGWEKTRERGSRGARGWRRPGQG